MFSKQDFQDWGKQNAVLFAAVMTKIEGRKNDDLLRTYGFSGFPSMAILDADGEAITKRVPRDLFSMQNIVAAAPDYVKLKAAEQAGEAVDGKAWFMARLGVGELEAKEAKELLASTGILLYAGTGVVTMMLGGNFLDYDMLATNPVTGQHIGIILIELGVGITVFAVMLIIFFVIAGRGRT